MARPGKFNHLKPEILRLIAEGVAWSDIRSQYPELPERTLADWVKRFRNAAESPAESTAKPPQLAPKPRLPIDPESPLEKIKHALWDIVYDPQGKGAAVQALNILLKIEAPWLAAGASEPQGESDANDIRVTRTVVNAQDA